METSQCWKENAFEYDKYKTLRSDFRKHTLLGQQLSGNNVILDMLSFWGYDPIFFFSKILLFQCLFSNRHATEHCSKTQVVLLSESKLKIAVYQNGGNYRKHLTKETSLLSNNEEFCPLFPRLKAWHCWGMTFWQISKLIQIPSFIPAAQI